MVNSWRTTDGGCVREGGDAVKLALRVHRSFFSIRGSNWVKSGNRSETRGSLCA